MSRDWRELKSETGSPMNDMSIEKLRYLRTRYVDSWERSHF